VTAYAAGRGVPRRAVALPAPLRGRDRFPEGLCRAAASQSFSAGWVSQVVYPMKFLGGTAMGLALLLALIVSAQGAKNSREPA
jgi:hypothetical protein